MKGQCPICRKKVVSPNVWVKYHVRYEPPIVILACRFCNWTERQLRRGIGTSDFERSELVSAFQARMLGH